MGIDIYILDKENDEHDWRVHDCRAYLREAYHGGPYATKILCREAFDADDCAAEIPAAILRERLTHVTEPANCSFDHMGALIATITKIMTSKNPPEGSFGFSLDEETIAEHKGKMADGTHPMSVEEAVRTRYETIYPDCTENDIQEAINNFREFVAFAEAREREIGKPCKIYASY